MVECRVPELLPLIAKLKAVVAEHQVKNDLIAGASTYIEYKVTSDFSYVNNGVEAKGGLTGRTILERDWTYAGGIVTKEVRSSSEFDSAAAAIGRQDQPGVAAETRVSNLIYTLAPKLIGRTLRTEQELFSEVDSFLDASSPNPTRREAKVELIGMSLQVPQVQLPGVLLRQTRREDLEKKVSIYSRRTEAVDLPYPGIIGEISVFGPPNEIHEFVRKLETMLRLFALASVNYSVYWYFVGSKSEPAHHPGTHSVPPLTALIRGDDEPRLKKFWSLLDPVLPHHLYERIPSGTVGTICSSRMSGIVRRFSAETASRNGSPMPLWASKPCSSRRGKNYPTVVASVLREHFLTWARILRRFLNDSGTLMMRATLSLMAIAFRTGKSVD